jgi:hypothetical protein
MAIITLDVPNRIVDAVATRHGYTGFLEDGITVQSKKDFVKKILSKWLKTEAKAHEAAEAAAAAAKIKENEVELLDIT